MGFELMTSSLPRMRSTPELHRHSFERGRRIELPFPAWKAGIIAIIRTPQSGAPLDWWARMDSNHRRYNQQIYSLPHLATLVLAQKHCLKCAQAERADGRIRTVDPEITNHVLWPAELHRQVCQCPFLSKRTANIGNFSENQKRFYKISVIFLEIPSASIPHSLRCAACVACSMNLSGAPIPVTGTPGALSARYSHTAP